MKRITFLFLAIFSLFFAQAQKGNNQLGVGLDVGVPLGDFGDAFGTGIGGSAKLLLGVGTSGQVTFTTGYMTFNAKDMPSGMDISANIIPFLLGYRHNLSGIYIEPQAGYGIYGSKISGMGSPYDGTDSEGAFTWAIGAGYAMNPGLDLGVRYQGGTKEGDSNNLIGLSLRWNFALAGGAQ